MYIHIHVHICIYVHVYIYIWQRLNKSVPQTAPLELNPQTSPYLKIFAGRKAPAAAIKKNKNVSYRICHHTNIHSEKGACGRYKHK